MYFCIVKQKQKTIKTAADGIKTGKKTMKTTYDYFDAIQKDLIKFLAQNNDIKASTAEELHANLFYSSVTGNTPDYYTTAAAAAEYLESNYILLGAALDSMGCTIDEAKNYGPQLCDVVIRCYLLKKVIKETVTFLAAA